MTGRKVLVLFVFLMLFFLFRKFSSSLYEPFEYFYDSGGLAGFPKEFDSVLYLGSISLKFLINMLLSVACVYFFFKDVGIARKAALVFVWVGLILIPMYFAMVHFEFPFGHLFAFYIRRIIIYPILLIVLLAGFEFLFSKTKIN